MLSQTSIDLIGYFATSLFTLSYVFKQPKALLSLQVAAASTWLLFGILVHQTPVIVANILVALSAFISLVRLRMQPKEVAAGAASGCTCPCSCGRKAGAPQA